jgi:hypothetical protein
MATLSTTNRAILVDLIRRLETTHDLPIDAVVVEQLDKVFGNTSGFPCACGIRGTSLRDSFRDAPIRTFLRLLLALDDAAGSALTPTQSGVLAP